MNRQIQVPEAEVEEVLAWAEEHDRQGTTDHAEGTYEQGVSDGIRWLLGYIYSRPDEA